MAASTSAEDLTMKDVLKEILNNQHPISKEEPGYLYMFSQYLDMAETSDEVKSLIPALHRFVKTWNNNPTRAKNDGAYEFITNCTNLLGTTLATPCSVETIELLQDLLPLFQKEMNPTREDCSSCLSTMNTSTSSTTVASRPAAAAARGSKRRRLCMDSEDEDELNEDGIFAVNSNLPTSKTSSSISRRVDGRQRTLKLEDEWRECQMSLQLWRSKDLVNVKDWMEKSNLVFRKMILNFDTETNPKLMDALGVVEEVVKQYLKKNGARVVQNRY